MPSKRVDVSQGDRYESLVVLTELPTRRSANGSVKRYFLCRCDCGKEVEVRLSHLRTGHTQSCGCYIPPNLRSHGMRKAPEYGVWKGMKRRCYQPSKREYPNYGGRGITICDRWRHSFKAFYEDMGPRPSPEHSIDRIDGNGNYEPGNCRWSTRREQNRNRCDNRFETFKGKTMCLVDWAAEYGMKKVTLYERLDRGMSFEEALTTPVRKWVRQAGKGRCVMRERHEQACEHCEYDSGGVCRYSGSESLK